MLEKIRIASPCHADWDQMTGNDRVRFCKSCQLNVYNFSAMTTREVEALVSDHEGRLCGRFYRRKDGTMLTQNCPVGLKRVVRHLSRVASAILAIMSPSFTAAQDITYIKSNVHDAALEIYVMDVMGAVISQADVTFSSPDRKNQIRKKTDLQGRLRLDHYSDGLYLVEITAPGFAAFRQLVSLRSGQVLQLRAQMSIQNMGVVVIVDSTPVDPDFKPQVSNELALYPQVTAPPRTPMKQ